MALQFSDMMSSLIFFDVVLFLLSSLITCASFMSVPSPVQELWQFLLIRDWPEIWIRKYPIWVLPNIWRMGRVKSTKFGMNVFNKILLNAAKCQGCSFYGFWVIKGNPTGGKIDCKIKGLNQVVARKSKNSFVWLCSL